MLCLLAGLLGPGVLIILACLCDQVFDWAHAVTAGLIGCHIQLPGTQNLCPVQALIVVVPFCFAAITKAD